jgi:hypothetical protein
MAANMAHRCKAFPQVVPDANMPKWHIETRQVSDESSKISNWFKQQKLSISHGAFKFFALSFYSMFILSENVSHFSLDNFLE